MEQKNTIVKCKVHPNCLFNHNGICDNYVINISADERCESYIETENEYDSLSAQEILEYTIELEREKIKRGQRAEGNFYDDACDISFLREDLEKIQKTLEQDSIPCTMKIAEFNKPNKNQSVISDWAYASTPDICKTCKKVVYGQPCKWKDVAYGVWTCYEEEK